MYDFIRNTHLLLASFSLPFLLMYSVSAVQMNHSTWFNMKPKVQERQLSVTPGQADARAVARELMDREPSVRGELANVQSKPTGMNLRIVVPGTVHEAQYDRASGAVHLKTVVGGFMVMLNRLHHAAGLPHETASMQGWGAAVAIVSSALLLLGATGIYLWFTRREERRIGFVLLAVDLAFASVLIR